MITAALSSSLRMKKKKASKTLDKKQKEPKKQSRTQRAG
jgi:hypothetical protein